MAKKNNDKRIYRVDFQNYCPNCKSLVSMNYYALGDGICARCFIERYRPNTRIETRVETRIEYLTLKQLKRMLGRGWREEDDE